MPEDAAERKRRQRLRERVEAARAAGLAGEPAKRDPSLHVNAPGNRVYETREEELAWAEGVWERHAAADRRRQLAAAGDDPRVRGKR